MKIEFSGKVWKMGADIDTDIITGSGSEAAKKCADLPLGDSVGRKLCTFGLYRPDFGPNVKEGDIIVAGKNFGCGSSREFAPAMIKACGIKAIIAPSFARIFYRNALNNGIYLLECPEAPNICEEGDIITVKVNECIEANGKTYPIPNIPKNLMEIIEDGGIVERMNKQMAKSSDANLYIEPDEEHKSGQLKEKYYAGEKVRPMTLVEKILINNSGDLNAKTGDIVISHPDMCMFHDIYTTNVINNFYAMGFKKVWDPDKCALILDHNSPTRDNIRGVSINDGFKFAKDQNISRMHLGIGIGHTLMHQLKYANPGEVVIVTDSHTTTYGGGACLGTGVGYSEMASLMGTGELWLKIPGAIKVIMDGDWPKGVYAKDFILKLLSDIKADGAQYKSLEFTGTAAHSLNMDGRYTISNMALECGAKAALFEADNMTAEYFGMDYEDIKWLHIDEDAEYEKVLYYNISELVPMLASPGAVDNGRPVSDWEGTKLTQCVIGSCTNASLSDIAGAAAILKGKHVPPYFKFYVNTASNIVTKEAIEKGYIQTLIDAGAIISAPNCSACGGGVGRLGDDDICVGTNNRNFLGRQGSKGSKVFLGSAQTAAASALCGTITDPRKYTE